MSHTIVHPNITLEQKASQTSKIIHGQVRYDFRKQQHYVIMQLLSLANIRIIFILSKNLQLIHKIIRHISINTTLIYTA